MSKLRISDTAIDHPDHDLLGMEAYARKLADYIQDVERPFTIGIYGAWGSGKTSFVNILKHYLTREDTAQREEEDSDRKPVKFIAISTWPYATADTVWRALIIEIVKGLYNIRDDEAEPSAKPPPQEQAPQSFLAALARSLTCKNLVLWKSPPPPPDEKARNKQEFETLMASLDGAYGSISRDSEQQLQINQEVALMAVVNAAVDALGTISPLVAGLRGVLGLESDYKLTDLLYTKKNKAIRETIESVEEFKKYFQKVFNHKAQEYDQIYVFIDDLDRCLPDVALDILEAIKIFLDDVECVFIVAADENLIGQGLRLRYKGLLSNIDEEEAQQFFMLKGQEYFEKIIQFHMRVPPRTPAQTRSFIAAQFPGWAIATDLIQTVVGDNPRQLKQSCNSLSYQHQVSQMQRAFFEADSRSDLLDKMVALYTLFRQNPDSQTVIDALTREPEQYLETMRALEAAFEPTPGETVVEPAEDHPYVALHRVAARSPSLQRAFQKWEKVLAQADPDDVRVVLQFVDVAPSRRPSETMLETRDRAFLRALAAVRENGAVSAEGLMNAAQGKLQSIQTHYPTLMDRLGKLVDQEDWSIGLAAIEAELAPSVAPSIPEIRPAPETDERQRRYLVQLRRILVQRFDLEELRTLCFVLAIDYDNLPGEGIAGKTRELVSYFERRNRIPELVQQIRQERPDIQLEDYPEITEAASPAPQVIVLDEPVVGDDGATGVEPDPLYQEIMSIVDQEERERTDADFLTPVSPAPDAERETVAIPADLLGRLRDALLPSDAFQDDASLSEVFDDARLEPWRDGIPTADDVLSRVDDTIAYLQDQNDPDSGENALVLLLRILGVADAGGDEPDSAPSALADELQSALVSTETSSEWLEELVESESTEPGLQELDDLASSWPVTPRAMPESKPKGPGLRELLSTSPRLSAILEPEVRSFLDGEEQDRQAALQQLELRLGAARHFLHLREFAKLFCLDSEWPDLGRQLRSRFSTLLELEDQVTQEQPPRLEENSWADRLWKRHYADPSFIDFLQLRPLFEEVDSDAQGEYFAVARIVKPVSETPSGVEETMIAMEQQSVHETAPERPRHNWFNLLFDLVPEGYELTATTPSGETTKLMLDLSAKDIDSFAQYAAELTSVAHTRYDRRRHELQRLGQSLGELFFPIPIREQFLAMSADQGKTRITLMFEDSILRRMPWEHLYFSELNNFLLLNGKFSLVRYVSAMEIPRSIVGQLRVQVVAPYAEQISSGSRELETIQKILEPIGRANLVLLSGTEAMAARVRRMLKDFRPPVFHYSGAVSSSAEEEAAALSHADASVSWEELTKLLSGADHAIRLFVFNGSLPEDSETDLIRVLKRNANAAAIATKGKVDAEMARLFSRTLYRFLRDGYSIDDAVLQCRLRLDKRRLNWFQYALYANSLPALDAFSRIPSKDIDMSRSYR